MMFFDSYAIIEVINGNEKYSKFEFEVMYTNKLNLSEVYYNLLKIVNERTADYLIGNLDINFVDISEKSAVDAAKFRWKNKKKKLSYADCIGYVSALENGMKFLTGDKEFEGVDDVEFVRK